MKTIETSPANLPDDVAEQLTHAIYDGRYKQFDKIATIVRPDDQLFPRGLTYDQRHEIGTRRYFEAQDKLGSSDLSDMQHVADLYAGFATSDPTAYPVLSGDHVLVPQAILHSGGDPETMQGFLHRLTTGEISSDADSHDRRHLGVILHTEARSGSNIPHIGTTATYEIDDEGNECFVINTPRDDPSLPPHVPNPDDKFFPNVGGDVPMVTSVTARLIVDGQDQGIAGFIVPMNTYDAPEGVYTHPISETGTPMAHRRISYYNVRIPARNWLSGEDEGIQDGTYYNNNPAEQKPSRRAERLMKGLYVGRMGLGAGASAMQRLSLHLYHEYAAKREIPYSRYGTLLRQPDVAREMTGHLVDAFAATALSNAVRRHFDEYGPDRLLANLSKPFITDSASRIIAEVAKPVGARAHEDANLFAPMEHANKGASTAEGINPLMNLASGGQLYRGARPVEIYGQDRSELPWWDRLLRTREEALRADPSFDEVRAKRLAQVTQVRLAYDALRFEAHRATGQAQEILAEIADIYAMDEVRENTDWFLDHGHLTPGNLTEREAIAQLRRELDQKIDHLTPLVPAIVQAFRLPKHIPHVPITAPDYLRQS